MYTEYLCHHFQGDVTCYWKSLFLCRDDPLSPYHHKFLPYFWKIRPHEIAGRSTPFKKKTLVEHSPKSLVICCFFLDQILPSYIGFLISQCKDPNEPNQDFWSIPCQGFSCRCSVRFYGFFSREFLHACCEEIKDLRKEFHTLAVSWQFPAKNESFKKWRLVETILTTCHIYIYDISMIYIYI